MKSDFCEYCGAPLNGIEKLVTVYRHSRGNTSSSREFLHRASLGPAADLGRGRWNGPFPGQMRCVA